MRILRSRKFYCAIVVALMYFVGGTNVLTQDLKSSNNRADYIVIAPSSYMQLAEQLTSFRSTNDAYITMAVSFDSVLAQFGSVSAPDSALRSFIRYTLQTWQKPAPKYFVLAGNINVIPSHCEKENSFPPDVVKYDSLCVDHWFVEGSTQQSGYGQAQAILGRLPAWDSAGLSVMIEKLMDYESSLSAPWWNKSIGLADFDTLTYDLFERDLRQLQNVLSTLWSDTVSVHMDSASQQHQDSIGFRDIWNQGASVMMYCGHANPFTLSATHYFTTYAVDSLRNKNRLPVCFFSGCNLRFDPQNPSSISVHLLEQPDAGAVACVASAGATYEIQVIAAFNSLFHYLISDPNQTVGEAFIYAKNLNAAEILRRLTFLGDPAMKIKHSGTNAVVFQSKSLPASFALDQNYPNPFNPSTTIRYALQKKSYVSLIVFNTLGQKAAVLVSCEKEAGYHEVRFDGSHLASGVYFCRMLAGSFVDTKKLILSK